MNPLVKTGVAGFGLVPENHRYFDYHHSDNDTNDKVHPRELEVGAIILATGYDIWDSGQIPQYGYGKYDNVITALEFERMTCAAGPTSGKIQLRDGRIPRSVAIIHCVGSRDKNYREYCSKICCMYALKHAHHLRDKINADVYQMYIDMRCTGDAYEEFYKRVSEEGVVFIKGKVAEVSDRAKTEEEKGRLVVVVEDALLGRLMRTPVDMVTLCPAIIPRADATEIARKFSITQKASGFFLERHAKLEPQVSAMDGIFLAGCCQFPKDNRIASNHRPLHRHGGTLDPGQTEGHGGLVRVGRERNQDPDHHCLNGDADSRRRRAR